MTNSTPDLDVSLGASVPLDFDWGERRGDGVTFIRPSASGRVRLNIDGTISNGNCGDAEATADADGGGAATPPDEMKITTVDAQDTIMLPQSTHSLLFTENVLSMPFAIAIMVTIISIMCLMLSLWDALSGNSPDNPLNLPVNVDYQVRIAQYLAIIIALLMEEEIPTGTYLLRMIPKSSVEAMGLSYSKFVFSAFIRLVIGFMFLLNVFFAVVQSDEVLDMFYDMLALNFISLCDDFAFKLMKYDVLGKRLRNAASTKYFRFEFETRPYLFRKKMTIFVKAVYVFNFLLFMISLTTVALYQRTGHFQCKSVTITFGEEIWENALVIPLPGEEAHADHDHAMSEVLMYSYFNGDYTHDGTHNGRPIYRELRKSSDSHFETKVGAVVKYCESESAWVFAHDRIRKSTDLEESECPWLLRSSDTNAYSLLDVSGAWSIWVGSIKKDSSMSVTCNGCKDNTDCNLNGQCTNGQCVCNSAIGYFGKHCEHAEPCPRIIDVNDNFAWHALYKNNCEPLRQYGRPTYSIAHMKDVNNITNNMTNINDDDIAILVYSGSRWLGVINRGGKNKPFEELVDFAREYHSFWDFAYDDRALFVSDPTTSSFPVGIDFYFIGERGQDHGPMGVLYPLQKPPGRGYFRCDANLTGPVGYGNHYDLCF